MTISYGTDVSTYPDLDPNFALVDSPTMVCQVILRRWTTPHALLDYDPDAGFDVRQYLNANLNKKTQLAALQRSLEQEAQKDERVLSCACVLTFIGNTLTINATVTLQGNANFLLVASVTALTVQILSVTPVT